MSSNGNGEAVTLDRVRALADALERGDRGEADQIVDELTALRESELFREMGSMTRQLHEALSSLRDVDARAARLVELRFFAGLSAEEFAEVLGEGRATVFRSWRFGRAYLARQLATE